MDTTESLIEEAELAINLGKPNKDLVQRIFKCISASDSKIAELSEQYWKDEGNVIKYHNWQMEIINQRTLKRLLREIF